MFWILSITLLVLSCEVELKSILEQDLRPRVSLFLAGKGGLDWLGGYEECKNQVNSTYALVQWHDQTFLYASYGVCLPSSCNNEETQQILSSYAKDLIPSYSPLLELIEFSQTNDEYKPEKYFFLACFFILIVLNTFSTIFGKFFPNNEILACFNAFDNTKSLFDLSKLTENLDIIDGIRSMCSFGIVLLHCEYFIMFLPIENRLEYLKRMNTPYYHLISSLAFCVDCFFYLAGFLMAYLTSKEIEEKREKFYWSVHFLRRIARYLPAYLFIVGFERCMPKKFPDSIRPLLFRFFDRFKKTPWWSALFFTQNFASGTDYIYLGWTWTICTDFQFFIISSLILYFYHKNKTFGYLTALFIITSSFLYTFSISYLFQVNASINQFIYNQFQMNLIYYKPWTRIAPYILGVVLGLIYLSSKKKNVSVAYSVKDSYGELFEKKCLSFIKIPFFRKVLCFMGFGLISTLIILSYCFTNYLEDSVGQIFKSVNIAFNRFLIILGLAFIVFPMKLGYFSWASTFLKIKVFRITGKLSYSLYLTHIILIIINLMGDDDVLTYGTEHVIKLVIKIYSLGLIVSFLIYVFIESPFLKLEKKIISR